MTRDLVLALDLTTRVGWSRFHVDGALRGSGSWDLKQPKHAHPGALWEAFGEALDRELSRFEGQICVIAFESPVMYDQWATARVAFGQAAIVELAGHLLGIATIGIPPATLKKTVTGKGNATKALVQEHVVRLTGELNTERGGKTKTERSLADKLRGDEADARAVGIVVTRSYEPDELRAGRFVERGK